MDTTKPTYERTMARRRDHRTKTTKAIRHFSGEVYDMLKRQSSKACDGSFSTCSEFSPDTTYKRICFQSSSLFLFKSRDWKGRRRNDTKTQLQFRMSPIHSVDSTTLNKTTREPARAEQGTSKQEQEPTR